MQRPTFRKESVQALVFATESKKTDTPLERFGSDPLFDRNVLRIICDYSQKIDYQKMKKDGFHFRMAIVQEAFRPERIQRMMEFFEREGVDPLTAFNFMI